MNDFFNSKFVEDLKLGVLPEVKVKVEDLTIIKLIIAGIVLLAIWYILKNN